MRSRYAYVRVSVDLADGIEVCGAVALLPGESCQLVYNKLRAEMHKWLSPFADADDAAIATEFERLVLSVWPGRSYFCEVGRGYLDEWVQIFQPDAGDWLSGT